MAVMLTSQEQGAGGLVPTGDQGFEGVAQLDRQLGVRVHETLGAKHAFGLAAEIDEHLLVGDGDDGSAGLIA